MEDNFNEKFRKRSKIFALEIIRLFQALPKSDEARIIGKQLLRSGTSVAANFRAACRARSSREYFAKICIVVEECDESIFWMEILQDAHIIEPGKLKHLLDESIELMAVFAKTKKNIKLNSPTRKFTNSPL
jgi:four helix bundle protein